MLIGGHDAEAMAYHGVVDRRFDRHTRRRAPPQRQLRRLSPCAVRGIQAVFSVTRGPKWEASFVSHNFPIQNRNLVENGT